MASQAGPPAAPLAAPRGTVEAGPEFAARLLVAVTAKYGDPTQPSAVQVHRGTILVPRWRPAARSAPKEPSPADRAAMLPLMRAHQEAMAAQERSIDLERLQSTFAALKGQLQAMERLQVHRVELSPKTVGHLLPDARPAELVEIPEGLLELQGEMEELTVQSSQLQRVPEWLGDLTRLTKLELSSCGSAAGGRVKELPTSLSKLTALKSLSLRALIGLKSVPDVGTLRALKTLTVDNCSNLKELPASFGTLRALKRLELCRCTQLEKLPAFGPLRALKTLELRHCARLEKLPGSLCTLPALESLVVVGCRSLRELPSQLGNLKTVKRLVLNGIKVRQLPTSIGNLPDLRFLSLGASELRTTAPSVLPSVNLGLLELRELPCSVGRLSSLVGLSISRCRSLQELRPLGNLGALKRLELAGLELYALPELAFCGLTSLVDLGISHCPKLKRLPEEVGWHSALESLRLDGCLSLKWLPASVGNLTRLTELSCTNCGLMDFPCIDALSALHTLKVVVSNYNPLDYWDHYSTDGERCAVFKSLSRSLPCLRLLTTLRLGRVKGESEYEGSEYDDDYYIDDDAPDLRYFSFATS